MVNEMGGMLLNARRFLVGGFTAQSSGDRVRHSQLQWFSFLKKRNRPAPLPTPKQIATDRDKAISLARLVLQKKNLGIALNPSQSLLISREFLQEIRRF
jgi:hypothetical protein